MTEHKKGSGKFDLNKPTKRSFDLSKDTDDIPAAGAPQAPKPAEKPVENPVDKPQPAQQPPIEEPPTPPQKGKGGKAFNTWIIIFFLAIAIALICWWLWPVNHDGEETSMEDMVENATDSTTAESDSVAEVDSAAIPTAVETAENAATTPASAEESDQEAVSANQEATAPTAKTFAAPAASTEASGSVEAEALKVIRGDYGNNPVRRKALGSRYAEVQARVNQLMKK